MEYIYDVHAQFKSEIRMDPSHKSEKIRDFVRTYGEQNFLDVAPEDSLYAAFLVEFPGIEELITRNYFHTVISRAFKTKSQTNPKSTIVTISDQIYVKGRIKKQQ